MNLVTAPTDGKVYSTDQCALHQIGVMQSDYQITPTTPALVQIDFSASASPLAHGTAFSIWGFDFETAATTSSKTFIAGGIGAISAGSFILMIRSNFNFANAVFSQIVDLGGGVYRVNLYWNECGELQNFAAPQTDLSALAPIADAITVTNGTTGENVQNFRVVTALQRLYGDPSALTFFPVYVSEFEATELLLTCGDADLISIDAMRQIRLLLRTPLPSLSPVSDVTSESNDQMWGRFRLAYGSTFTQDCQSDAGTIEFGTMFEVINAAMKAPNEYGLREYTDNAVGGLAPSVPLPLPLTTQPAQHYICADSNAWLWYYYTDGATDYNFQFVVKLKNGDPDVTYTSSSSALSVKILHLNATPQRVATLSGVALSNIASYTVRVRDNTTVTHAERTYILKDCKCGETDLYFLSEAGGFVTLLVTVERRETIRESEERFLNANNCSVFPEVNASRTYRTQQLTRVYDRVQLRVTMDSQSPHALRMFRDCARSPVMYIKEKDHNGIPARRRFVPDADSIPVGPKSGDFEFTLVGYLQDDAVQTQLSAAVTYIS